MTVGNRRGWVIIQILSIGLKISFKSPITLYYNSSVNRSYYAMFQAAQIALSKAGFSREEWSHPGLQAVFAILPLWPSILIELLSCDWLQIIEPEQSLKKKHTLLYDGRKILSQE